jgi:hypothetical protein
MPSLAPENIFEAPILVYPSPVGLEIDCEAGIGVMFFSAQQLRISPKTFKNYNGFVNLTNKWNIYVSKGCVFLKTYVPRLMRMTPGSA